MNRFCGGPRPARGTTKSLSTALLTLFVAASVLAGCESDPPTAGPASGGGGAPVAPTTAPIAAKVAVAPADGAAKVRLDKAVTVKVSQGTLSTVEVSTSKGQALAGELSADKLSWTSTAALAPGARYTVSVAATSNAGSQTSTTSRFRTLTPADTATAVIQPRDGWVVGVGMPVIVNFSTPVSTSRRAKVEKALTVRTTDDLDGSWRWLSSEQVQWRPKTYWPSGTKVRVTANLAGVELAKGVWGQAKRTSDFAIGSAMISTVDVKTHTMTVRRNGQVIRTIPVTTGKPGFASRNGVKVIMSRESSRRMDAATTGTEASDPEYYNITVKYAMRLTYSGEFLHQAEWSVADQGRANVSHGCTGMSPADAKWLFNQSKVGDVFVYKNSTRTLEWGNGYTAFDLSWPQWNNA